MSGTYIDLPVSTANGPATQAPKLVQEFDTDAGTAVGKFVKISAPNTVTAIADNSFAEIPNGIFGVVADKPTTITADVIFAGILEGYSGLTAGLPVFVSVTGLPSHTPPVSGMSQQIGFAVSTTAIFFSFMTPTEV